MPRAIPHEAATRTAVESALRDGDEPITAIARRFGLSQGTVRDWNRASGIRIGVRRPPVRDTMHGLAAIRAGSRGLPDLRAALREHVGRQIAAMDARLSRAHDPADSGRTLRDLAGLKRLIDEMEEEAARNPARGSEGARDATGEDLGIDPGPLRLPYARCIEIALSAFPETGLSFDDLPERIMTLHRLKAEDPRGFTMRYRWLIRTGTELGVLPNVGGGEGA